MSDWKFLNEHRCRIASRTVPQHYCTTEADGWNGMFRFSLDGKSVRCVASDGEGWQHVSVTEEFTTKPLTWGQMCKIKDLFWDADDVVVQFHPAKKDYVNYHPACLHLWRCTDRAFPTPDPLMVGPGRQKPTP